MEIIKVKMHSAVDLITNSSTVIFTYSNGALPKVKELVNEMLIVFGHEDKTFDDIFYADIFLDDYNDIFVDEWVYEIENKTDEIQQLLKMDCKERNLIIEKIQEEILKGKIERPQWMKEADESKTYDGFKRDNSLFLLPKDINYLNLGKKITSFLYSIRNEASYG